MHAKFSNKNIPCASINPWIKMFVCMYVYMYAYMSEIWLEFEYFNSTHTVLENFGMYVQKYSHQMSSCVWIWQIDIPSNL